MKIGISGSSGFIGKRLLARLEQSGYDVVRLGRNGLIPSGIEVVFDLAAYGNMAHHEQDAFKIYKANLLRVLTSLE